jgi:hypothetical protein
MNQFYIHEFNSFPSFNRQFGTLTLTNYNECLFSYTGYTPKKFHLYWNQASCFFLNNVVNVRWDTFENWIDFHKNGGIIMTSRPRSHNYYPIHVQVNSIPKGITTNVHNKTLFWDTLYCYETDNLPIPRSTLFTVITWLRRYFLPFRKPPMSPVTSVFKHKIAGNLM